MEQLYTYADAVVIFAIVAGVMTLASILVDGMLAMGAGLATVLLIGLLQIVPNAQSTRVTGEPLLRMVETSRTSPVLEKLVVESSKDGSISIAEYRLVRSTYEELRSRSAQNQIRAMSRKTSMGQDTGKAPR